MRNCPYPETIIDESSGIIVSNDQYLYWLEGYDAQQLELANRLTKFVTLIQELKDEIKKLAE
jgi:hypothetical protein